MRKREREKEKGSVRHVQRDAGGVEDRDREGEIMKEKASRREQEQIPFSHLHMTPRASPFEMAAANGTR